MEDTKMAEFRQAFVNKISFVETGVVNVRK